MKSKMTIPQVRAINKLRKSDGKDVEVEVRVHSVKLTTNKTVYNISRHGKIEEES